MRVEQPAAEQSVVPPQQVGHNRVETPALGEAGSDARNFGTREFLRDGHWRRSATGLSEIGATDRQTDEFISILSLLFACFLEDFGGHADDDPLDIGCYSPANSGTGAVCFCSSLTVLVVVVLVVVAHRSVHPPRPDPTPDPASTQSGCGAPDTPRSGRTIIICIRSVVFGTGGGIGLPPPIINRAERGGGG